MSRDPNDHSSKEFREEAVKLVIEGGVSVYEPSCGFGSVDGQASHSVMIMKFFDGSREY